MEEKYIYKEKKEVRNCHVSYQNATHLYQLEKLLNWNNVKKKQWKRD